METFNYPETYVTFLVEFNGTRDYFECHELLEDYWKSHPGDALADTWVGLIQIAVASYHYRRGNSQGAVKMFRKSLERLLPERLEQLGLNGDGLMRIVEAKLSELEQGASFRDIILPILDQRLLDRCMQHCSSRNIIWGAKSPHDEELLHRHKLRDRSDVIEARAAAIAVRKSGGAGSGGPS
ncbi:DUF309 domain-containing protein [Paenibacillus nasutitermitis]|uniref:DUF309 domain-containing protein n=1 Tax=Paenibacillus nasutitermitis TaxID=1652958 RepID=A0A916YWM6_9BACL|nr:DUF309 domain-containing protein [Paenibacillus nasutitermitis]GGD64136.1 hypothetical protein GCM10010911_22360 [Paenibacillus nasutitermitis]